MLQKNCISLTILLLVFLRNIQCNSSTIRHILNGPIEGIQLTSALGQKYVAFKGIRYAMPPITGTDPLTGDRVDRRFKAPQPINQSWIEPQLTQNYGKGCIPSKLKRTDDDDIDNFSEDCLFLNVYIPADGSIRKSVVVFIHGGTFAHGDATDKVYGPDFLISQDNIVVTLQYRLGILGFMNLEFGEYTGNMGLKDQQLAIKWVYNNIESFSGKKDEILLFGYSAGGASVHYHMLNEESRRYFYRAFVMSSSAFSSYAMHKTNHVEHLREYFKKDKLNELIDYLKRANATDLNKSYQFEGFDRVLRPMWVPTIEKANTNGAFMTKTPDEMYRSGNVPIMDAMFSFTEQEILVFAPYLFLSKEPLLNQNWSKSSNITILPFESEVKLSVTHPKKLQSAIEMLRDKYFQDRTNITAVRNANIALMSDMTFADSIIKAAVKQTIANTNQQKKTFLYRFSSSSDLKFFDYMKILPFKTTHIDDLSFIFHIQKFKENKLYDIHLKRKDEVYDMIMRSVKMITNFARTGDPSIAGDTPFQACRSENEIFCHEISNDRISSITYDIKKQIHYDTWREVERLLSLDEKGAGNTLSHHHLIIISTVVFIHLLLRNFYL